MVFRAIAAVLFSLPFAHAELRPDERAALDTYLTIRTGVNKELAPIVTGTLTEVNSRVAEADKIVVEEIPGVNMLAADLGRQITEINDDIRYISSMNFDYYKDQQWHDKMRAAVTQYCCALRAGTGPKPSLQGLLYTRLKRGGGGGNPGAYNANTNLTPGGGGGPRRGGPGGRRGGGPPGGRRGGGPPGGRPGGGG